LSKIIKGGIIMVNSIKQKITSVLKGFLYLITFKIIYAVLRLILKTVVNILYSGYYLIFFYGLLGAYAYLFMGLRFDGEIIGAVYIIGAVFWFIISTIVMLKNLDNKRIRRAVKREYDKRFNLIKGEIEYDIRNRKTKADRRKVMEQYFTEDVVRSYLE
jgi:hypothetical protein